MECRSLRLGVAVGESKYQEEAKAPVLILQNAPSFGRLHVFIPVYSAVENVYLEIRQAARVGALFEISLFTCL